MKQNKILQSAGYSFTVYPKQKADVLSVIYHLV